jgi:TRAP-type uncharacterized transport system substrate-binding protein
MNTLKTVFEKLFKEETQLASHEVDLALVDNVKKAYLDAIAARKKSFDEYQKLKPILANALKMQLDLQKANQDSIPIFDTYEKAVKELGISIPKEIADQKKNIQDGLKGTFAQYVKTLQSIKL